MNEVGGFIVANAAAMESQGCVSQVGSGCARKANVDRFGLHVQTVHGNSGVRAF